MSSKKKFFLEMIRKITPTQPSIGSQAISDESYGAVDLEHSSVPQQNILTLSEIAQGLSKLSLSTLVLSLPLLGTGIWLAIKEHESSPEPAPLLLLIFGNSLLGLIPGGALGARFTGQLEQANDVQTKKEVLILAVFIGVLIGVGQHLANQDSSAKIFAGTSLTFLSLGTISGLTLSFGGSKSLFNSDENQSQILVNR